jgi:hypothetical protein
MELSPVTAKAAEQAEERILAELRDAASSA